MTIITINEENHGLIGAVSNQNLIIPWLIDNHWLDSCTTIIYGHNEREYNECTVYEFYGVYWEKRLKSKNINELNEIFDGTFLFCPLDVWEG